MKRLVAPAPNPLAAPVIAATLPSIRPAMCFPLCEFNKLSIYDTIKPESGLALRMVLLRKSSL
jgi:hypothetical protein